MKKILVVLVTVFISSLSFSQGINFEKRSFSEALLKAQKEQKIVFVDCYAIWCKPCRNLSKNIFPQERVGNFFNKNFVSLKMDIERGEGKKIRRKYKIESLPTLLFLDSKGKVLHKVVGVQDADVLIEEAKKALEQKKDSEN